MLRDGEEVGVDEQSGSVGVERGEHLADVGQPHLALVEHGPLLSQENTVGHCSVGVLCRVMVQTDHVAFGDEVEHHGGEESKEANDSTEHGLQSPAVSPQSCVQEDVRHEEHTGPTGAVREGLDSSDGSAQTSRVDELFWCRRSTGGQGSRGGSGDMPLVDRERPLSQSRVNTEGSSTAAGRKRRSDPGHGHSGHRESAEQGTARG